jgi:glycosyltransferase involved in cell wall biosynthesis
MIRVILLAPTLFPGGAERQMVYLAAGLPRDRFDVRFVLLAERGPLASEAEAAGVPVRVLGLTQTACRAPGPACVRTVAHALRRYRALIKGVDIVDAWTVPAYTFAGLVRPLAGVPVLLAGRRSLPDVQRTRTRARELARAVAMRRVDGVVANSQAAADAAVSVEGIAADKVHVIRNAVTPGTLSADERARLRAGWGVADDQVLIGCVASLREGKGHAMLIDVIARLRASDDRVRAVFVGSGRQLEPIVSAIEARGLGETIVLDTGVSDARRVPGAFDVAVQASDTEGLPNAVLEAAAAGVAIVATAVGGTPEVIIDGRDGILVPRADPEALFQGLDRLLRDDDLRNRLGRAAEERAGVFTPDALVSHTAALYDRLLRASAGKRVDPPGPGKRTSASGSEGSARALSGPWA